MSEHPTNASACSSSPMMPTPTARLGDSRGAQGKRYLNPDQSNVLDDAVDALTSGLLLPTPTANQPGGTAEQHLARKQRMPDGANRTTVTDLRMALEVARLLPTPTASDAKGPSPGHAGTTAEAIRDLHMSSGVPTQPPSPGGSGCSDGQLPLLWTTEGDSLPGSSSG